MRRVVAGLGAGGPSPTSRRAVSAETGRPLVRTHSWQRRIPSSRCSGSSTLDVRYASQATVKSLLTFAWRTGYTVYNVGRALRCVKVPSKVHEKILEEPEVKQLFQGASQGRDLAFIRLMYASGARVSELCRLRWVDLAQPGRVTVLGKGQKVRTMTVPQKILDEVKALKPGGALLTDPVFTSKRSPGRPLCPQDARAIVYRARDKAGLGRKVAPHALHHSHASHALDYGCKLHVLRDSLGHANISTTSVYLHTRPNQGSAEFLDL